MEVHTGQYLVQTNPVPSCPEITRQKCNKTLIYFNTLKEQAADDSKVALFKIADSWYSDYVLICLRKQNLSR